MAGPRTLALAVLLASGVAAAAETPPLLLPVKSYAQELVDRLAAAHPELHRIVLHAGPGKDAPAVVIASNIGRIGQAAAAADLAVLEDGKIRVATDPARQHVEVELPLHDAAGQAAGTLTLAWKLPPGSAPGEFERDAVALRDALARRILNQANLLDPYPFVPGATTRTRAQALVEDALQRHPEVTVLALRARVQPTNDLVLLGSSFGRHGKKADADDLKVLNAVAPIAGIYSNGHRFGADLALRDAGGTAVGTLNVGYAWRADADARALLAQALALREELQARIAAIPDLNEIAP